MDVLIQTVAEVWLEAARVLGFRVTAPYEIRVGSKTIRCIGFLPDFGSPSGTIIGISVPPDFHVDPDIVSWARARGAHCSFLNPETYAKFDQNEIKDTLHDWGYYGPLQTRPSWLL